MEQRNSVMSHLHSMFANAKLPLTNVIMELAIAPVIRCQAGAMDLWTRGYAMFR